MFNCGAPYNNIGGEYWVGDTELTTPCRSGRRASFTPWPTADIGKVIRRPALSSSESVTTSSSDQTTFASSSALSATSASTFTVSSELVASSVNASSVAGTHQPGDSTASADRQSLALGAGLGVPLGMASLGFMAFLFWKLRQQKQKSIPYRDSTQAQKSRRERTIDQAARELSGGETGQEMWAENLREIPEIDSRQRHETGTYYP